MSANFVLLHRKIFNYKTFSFATIFDTEQGEFAKRTSGYVE